MNLYIQIKDGQPYEHPIMEDNFVAAFPDIDVRNLPPNFAPFVRVPKPNSCDVYEIEECTYGWDNGVVKDIWVSRPMTEQERIDKDEFEKARLIDMVERAKVITQTNIDNADTEEKRLAWEEFLTKLNSWVYTDWHNSMLPTPPSFPTPGALMAANIDAPGTAPNVTG